MPFDPTKPADNAQITGQVFRDQYNALKALIDAQQAVIDNLQSQFNDLSLFAGDTNEALIQLQQQVAALQGNS